MVFHIIENLGGARRRRWYAGVVGVLLVVRSQLVLLEFSHHFYIGEALFFRYHHRSFGPDRVLYRVRETFSHCHHSVFVFRYLSVFVSSEIFLWGEEGVGTGGFYSGFHQGFVRNMSKSILYNLKLSGDVFFGGMSPGKSR